MCDAGQREKLAVAAAPGVRFCEWHPPAAIRCTEKLAAEFMGVRGRWFRRNHADIIPDRNSRVAGLNNPPQIIRLLLRGEVSVNPQAASVARVGIEPDIGKARVATDLWLQPSGVSACESHVSTLARCRTEILRDEHASNTDNPDQDDGPQSLGSDELLHGLSR